MIYTCDRCEYKTERANDFKKHLLKATQCPVTNLDISKEDIFKKHFKEKDRTDYQFCCEKCEKKFKTSQGKYNHKQICKAESKPLSTIDKKNDDFVDLLKRVEKLEQAMKVNTNIEKHYQALVEKMTNGTHKRLECGVTDITTNEFHAEIKRWIAWKEALGQILAYNCFDEKCELRVYFFGEYSKKNKDIAIKAFKKHNIKCYQFLDESNYEEIIY